MSNDDDDAERTARLKEEGRRSARALQSRFESEGNAEGWFDALYREAGRERARVPWADAAPRFKLEEWLSRHPGVGQPALDVGCGLGDNARCLAEAGYQVTGFDLSEAAVGWAQERHQGAGIAFRQGDLLDPPAEWIGAFPLVHETYNLQAMPREMHAAAMLQLARLVAPGGMLIVITRIREADEVAVGPPWPAPAHRSRPALCRRPRRVPCGDFRRPAIEPDPPSAGRLSQAGGLVERI
ncbi:MAG: methyltransferase domain-containing protein [Hyphomicrobiaceae bacterium]